MNNMQTDPVVLEQHFLRHGPENVVPVRALGPNRLVLSLGLYWESTSWLWESVTEHTREGSDLPYS